MRVVRHLYSPTIPGNSHPPVMVKLTSRVPSSPKVLVRKFLFPVFGGLFHIPQAVPLSFLSGLGSENIFKSYVDPKQQPPHP